MRTTIRGKYYISPPNDELDVKELLKHAVASGSGRPVDNDGLPQGSWTPDLLADAILQVDQTGVGVDLRTVQNWFQDNERGVGPSNIRWLARVFGCGEPQLVGEWQTALSAANRRFNTKRKEKRAIGKRVTDDGVLSPGNLQQSKIFIHQNRKLKISKFVENLFLGSPLNLPFFVWAGCVCLAFISFIMGVHSIEYSPVENLSKQVGFFWAPNWTLLEMVVLPLFLMTVSDILTRWRREIDKQPVGWKLRTQSSFELSHSAAAFICFIVVFLIQWSTVHMKALKSGNVDDLMMDWNLIAILRPEVISISEATILSMLAFLYTACICYLFLSGLIIVCQVATEFREYCSHNSFPSDRLAYIGEAISDRSFRCAVLGVMVATCIKVQAAYLVSDSVNIFSWLLQDAYLFLGLSDTAYSALNQKALASFSSFMLMFSTFSVFCYVTHQLAGSLKKIQKLNSKQWKMRIMYQLAVVLLTVINFLSVGAFVGFSLLLVCVVSVSILCLVNSTYLKPKIWNNSEEVQQ